MSPILYLLPLPHLAAIALWAYSAMLLNKRGLAMREVSPASVAHMRAFPFALAAGLVAMTAYPFLIQTGRGGLPAVLAIALLSALVHIYLVYVALFHWIWMLSALFRPTSPEPREALRRSYARSIEMRKTLMAGLAAAAILLLIQIVILILLGNLRAQLGPGAESAHFNFIVASLP